MGYGIAKNHKTIGFIQVTILYALANFAAYLLIPNFNLIKRDLGVTDGYLGALTGGFIFFNGLGALLWSYLSDAYGVKRKGLLAISFVFSGLFILLVSMSSNPWLIMFFWLLAGGFLGAVVPLGFSIISDLFPPEKRTNIFMLWFFLSGFGLAFGYGISLFLGAYYNWRLPITVGGIIIIVVGSIASMTLWEPSKGWIDIQRFGGTEYTYRFQISDLRLIAENKTNIYIVLQGFFGTIANGALFSWTVHYLIREWGLSEIMASMFIAVSAVGAIGGFPLSYLADKLYERNEAYRPLIAAMCSITEGILFAIFFTIPIRINLYTNDPIEGFFEMMRILQNNPLILGTILIFFFGMFMNPAPGTIKDSVLSDANLPEHRSLVLAGSNIIEIFPKALSITLVGVLSDYFGTLRIPLMITMLIWIISGIAWIYAAKNYRKDRMMITKILDERIRKSKK